MHIVAQQTSHGASEFKESFLIVIKLLRLYTPQLQQVGPASTASDTERHIFFKKLPRKAVHWVL